MFDDGQVLTENVAILAWVADRAPQLAPSGDPGRYRLLEMLSFIASEIHKRFPFYLSLPQDIGEQIASDIGRWLAFLAHRLKRGYWFDERFSVADACDRRALRAVSRPFVYRGGVRWPPK
jgi:glutathione S-transferase